MKFQCHVASFGKTASPLAQKASFDRTLIVFGAQMRYWMARCHLLVDLRHTLVAECALSRWCGLCILGVALTSPFDTFVLDY